MDRPEPLLLGISFSSTGVTFGLSFFSYETVGILISIISTVILTTITVYINIKNYQASKESNKLILEKEKLDKEETETRIKLLQEQLNNEKSKDACNAHIHVRNDSDNSNRVSKSSRNRNKNK